VGLRGLVVSDYSGVEQMQTRHHVAADKADAAAQALDAGVTSSCPIRTGSPSSWAGEERPHGGVRDRSSVAHAAREVPGRTVREPLRRSRSSRARDEHGRSIRRWRSKAARKSIVLLKNQGALLPLDRARVKTLAVVGPNAKGVHLGGYSRDPGRGIDVLSGITARAGAGVKVVYAERRAASPSTRPTGAAIRWCSAIRRRTARVFRTP
jgi:beta-glucosidase